MIHTSFILFKEYASLLDIQSVDNYIEYGGTLKMENMGFDNPYPTVSELSQESTFSTVDRHKGLTE